MMKTKPKEDTTELFDRAVIELPDVPLPEAEIRRRFEVDRGFKHKEFMDLEDLKLRKAESNRKDRELELREDEGPRQDLDLAIKKKSARNTIFVAIISGVCLIIGAYIGATFKKPEASTSSPPPVVQEQRSSSKGTVDQNKAPKVSTVRL